MPASMKRLDKMLGWFAANLDALLLGAIVAAVLVAIMLVLRQVGRRITARDPHCTSWKSVIGRVLAKTSLGFMVVAALEIVANYAEPPAKIGRLFEIAFVVAASLQGAVWGRELVIGLISRKVAEDNGGGTIGNAMAIIRVLVSVALFAIAIILILQNLGVNVTALVAGLGIGGIAIGLAAQGIFSDLFAALAILFDKPFRRGDTIRYDNSTGTVERIGLKTTRLRALTGEQLIMANTKLLEREIHNLAQAESRRMTVLFAVAATGSDKLDTIADLASQAVRDNKDCRLVRCTLTGIGSGAFGHELVYDDRSGDNDRIARNRSDIIRSLMTRLEAAGMELQRASDIQPPLAPF
ncbi:mechanosensitive ion channel [Sphingomonas piscis]|uniref:Mechanosensitive ion channel n=2 Tax=Sphingomonas piscis TaxID=2714943 RepID=A0A6G7YT06_9SPHN|nr:mechanosensitive ion channel [Sphingomonas piscis]